MIAAGVLVLLFAAFQLWGTGIAEARAQDSLDDEFASKLAEVDTQLAEQTSEPVADVEDTDDNSTKDTAIEDVDLADQDLPLPTPANTLPQLTLDQLPKQGEATGRIIIPAIGVTKTFVEGVTRDVLRDGPGHYPTTPLPGQPGNAAIAGHRTTHGAPFFDIDKLVPGDEIQVETLQGNFTYIVEGHDNGPNSKLGHFLVDPSDVHVIADQGDNRLTLTACHPKYSAEQRIIVTAVLASEPAPANPTPAAGTSLSPDDGLGADETNIDVAAPEQSSGTSVAAPEQANPDVEPAELADAVDTETATRPETTSESDPTNTIGSEDGITDSLGWQPEFAGPTVLWAIATALVAVAAWVVGRMWRRWPAYALASPAFLFLLFTCFTYLDKFIPAV